MSDATTIRDRAAGAVMGAFVGEALGLGPTGITISMRCGGTTARGSPTTPIPGRIATMPG
ncbi:hypothetical protein [Geobacter anodireducens]